MIVIDKDNGETDLLELLKKVKPISSSYYAIHFLFSKLLDKYRGEYQVRIATNIMSDVLGKDSDGFIVICDDLDVFLIFNVTDRIRIQKVIEQLKHLFVDDTLLASDDMVSNLCQIFDLHLQWNQFFWTCKNKIDPNLNKKLTSNKMDISIIDGSVPVDLPSLLYAEGVIEKKNPDIWSLIDIEAIYVSKDNNLKVIFDEITINYNKLSEVVGIKIDFESSNGLYIYIENIMKKKVLQYIVDKSTFARPINILLSIEMLSSVFFTNIIKETKQKNIPLVIDIEILDLLANIEKLHLINELLKSYGISVCLRNEKFIDLNYLQYFDLIKINSELDLLESQGLQDKIGDLTNRIIMYNCNNKKLFDKGKSCGFFLFHGKYLKTNIKLTTTSKIKRKEKVS